MTVGNFFKASDIKVYFAISLDVYTWNCTAYDDRVKFYTLNPPLNLSFHSQFDMDEFKCRTEMNQSMFNIDTKLLTNFTIYFECDLCTNGYQVGLTEVFVNTNGAYETRILT